MADETPPKPSDDDLHRKFREALQRKKNASHPTAGPGEDSDGKTGAVNKGTVTRKREFRRKSG